MCTMEPASTPLPPPPKFSWVIPGKLAAHGLPLGPRHMQYLWEEGVRHVVSVIADRVPLQVIADYKDMNWIHISVRDYHAPTMEQVELFLDAVEKAHSKGEAVSVHCRMGRGRTGTMLACYLVKTRHITAKDAIQELRQIRPGSLETDEQEKMVAKYYRKVKKSW
ncbi:dual specificity protein phosphatase 23-like isoform X1 [Amphiura filiformis]|uniref:dual specificity protein phosphatase 23-like isoform X1 n=1 Tax=Amphiura filiformis TaxID=82378 RepID=UPI003B224FB3